MTNQEKALAVKALVRRGARPIDVARADAEIAAHNGHRNVRGNISWQHGNVRTDAGLDELRAKRRAKLGLK